MKSFKNILAETRNISPNYNDFDIVPHKVYVGPKNMTNKERLTRMLQREPTHTDDPRYERLHQLVDTAFNNPEYARIWNGKETAVQPVKKVKMKADPRDVARMFINGATMYDVNEAFGDSINARQASTHMRIFLHNVQKNTNGPKIMLGAVTPSTLQIPTSGAGMLPGNAKIKSFLTQQMEDEHVNLRVPEMHDRYISPHTGRRYEDLSYSEKESMKVIVSYARKARRKNGSP